MNVRGKWGVTRNHDGDLADIWQWPWYWRYPAAVAVLGVATWLAFNAKWSEVTLIIVLGVALLFALSIAYELGCLVVLLSCGWAIWAASEWLLPDFDIPMKWQIGIAFAVAIYGAFLAKSATDRIAAQQKTIDRLTNRLSRIEDEWRDSLDTLHFRLRDMESGESRSRHSRDND